MQLAVPKVVRIAVSTVMMMLRIFPQVVLLLNVPIVVRTPPPAPPVWEGVYSTGGNEDFVKGLIDKELEIRD